MKKIFLLLVFVATIVSAQTDPNWQTQLDRYALAGVTGGIPNVTNIIATLNPGDNIQNAIDAAYNAGGGVVLLNPGIYNITGTGTQTTEAYTNIVQLRDNVVLRGVDRNTVILQSEFRANEYTPKFYSTQITLGRYNGESVSYAGLENLTYYYKVDGNDPSDDISGVSENFYEVHKNGGVNNATNLHVTSIEIRGSNCWVKNVDIIESGSSPLVVWGNHNTIIGNNIHRTYCKGGEGNGYLLVSGNDNLIINNDLERLRHLILSEYNGTPVYLPTYNVFYGNDLFRTEMNFHTSDAGYNLVENNIISPEAIHHVAGQPYNTGVASSGHAPPSNTNIIFNNDVSGSGRSQLGGVSGVVYRTSGQLDNHNDAFNHIVVDSTSNPIGGTFYTPVVVTPGQELSDSIIPILINSH